MRGTPCSIITEHIIIRYQSINHRRAGIIRGLDKHTRFQISFLQQTNKDRLTTIGKQMRAIDYPWFAGMFSEQMPFTIARRRDLPPKAAAEREFCERHFIESAAFSPVHIETIRYYERRGLLKKPPRSVSNYRLYSEATVKRVLFIKRAQKLGFTLTVIKNLLVLRERQTGQCAPAYARFRLKIIENERQIETLQMQLETLRSLTEACAAEDSGDRCVLIAALESDEVLAHV